REVSQHPRARGGHRVSHPRAARVRRHTGLISVLADLALATALQVLARSRSTQPGELVVLAITAPVGTRAVRVRAFDRDIAAYAVDERRWQALVGIDLDAKPGTYAIAVSTADGHDRTSYDLLVRPKRFPTRRLTVDPDFVTPPASADARIAREAK